VPGSHKNLLIFTAEAQFGELLRLSLEETGNYQVALCYTPAEVLSHLARAPFDLLIYDTGAADLNYMAVLRRVASDYPQLPLLVFPPDDDPHHPSLEQVNVWAFLNKPFYTPDLLHMVERLCRGERIIPPPPPLPDAQEPLQQFLVEFLKHSAAKAVWIFSAGRLFVEAGSLPSSLRDSLSAYLEEQWEDRIDYGERLRFATPSPQVEESPLLLYSRPLSAQTLLVLLFPASIPLSQVRREGISLNTMLKDSPWLTAAFLLTEASPAVTVEATAVESEAPHGETEELPPEWQTEWPESNEEAMAIDLSLVEQWLAEAPPPNPDLEAPPSETGEGDWLLEEAFAPEDHLVELTTPETAAELMEEAPPPNEESAPTILEPTLESPTESTAETVELPIEAPTQPEAVAPQPSSEFAAIFESAIQAPAPDETQPIPIHVSNEYAETHRETVLVTIALVPAVEGSLKNAEIAKELARWLPLRCARMGWNLKKLALAATYALLTLELPATLSTDWAVTLLRQQSSQRLFNRVKTFPANLADEAFWSTHYLALPGEHLPDSAAIERLIAAARSPTNHPLD